MRDFRLATTSVAGAVGLAVLSILCAAQPARADVILSQGALSVTIRSDSGAINNVAFAGTEFYREGVFVSNFGFQVGTNTTTFRLNDTNGGAGTPVAVAGTTTAIVTGVYTAGGANIAFTRTYELVSGLDVLRTTTTFTNNGAATTLRAFDTADPDQGIDLGFGFATINDIYSLSGLSVGRATATGGTGYTVVFGPDGVLGFGGGTSPFGLGIGSGAALNTFFNTPFDPNGATADIGFGFGRELNLAPGASATITFDQAFGTSQAAAESAFLAAQAVPEPASLAVFGLATLAAGYVGYRRRKRVVA